jgi:hypothetical protein
MSRLAADVGLGLVALLGTVTATNSVAPLQQEACVGLRSKPFKHVLVSVQNPLNIVDGTEVSRADGGSIGVAEMLQHLIAPHERSPLLFPISGSTAGSNKRMCCVVNHREKPAGGAVLCTAMACMPFRTGC